MMTWLAISLFTSLWIIPSLIIAPAVFRALVRAHARDYKPSALHAVSLAFFSGAGGTALALLSFSLVARIIPNYSFALPASWIFVATLSIVLRRLCSTETEQRTAPRFPFIWFGIGILGILAIQTAFWLPRLAFSDIHFDPNHFGAEKLFNLSLQQSFTFGHGYPPQSLWLAGEPESYYILPRILPGLAAHVSVHWFAASTSVAGLFFHFSDAF
jgi:hypothetical protein